MTRLSQISNELIRNAPSSFHRFLFYLISLDSRMTGIVGPRGVGKTSLLLQLLKEKLHDQEGVLYAQLDDVHFSTQSLFDFAKEFVLKGGMMLALDNLHTTLDANTVSNLRDFLLYHGVEELDDVKIKVIKERGPGGGLPLVGFTGSKKSLLNVYEWYSMDDPTWIDDARELYPQLFESCSSTAGDETEKEVYHMLSHEELYKEIMSMIEEEGRTSIADKELATKIIAKFEELMKWRKVPRRK